MLVASRRYYRQTFATCTITSIFFIRNKWMLNDIFVLFVCLLFRSVVFYLGLSIVTQCHWISTNSSRAQCAPVNSECNERMQMQLYLTDEQEIECCDCVSVPLLQYCLSYECKLINKSF